MARDPKYDILFEAVQLGPKTMKNRFYQTSYSTALARGPKATAEFLGMRAEGGWAVVSTDVCSIHPESDNCPWLEARIWDDNDVRNFSHLVDLCHEQGALTGIELFYGGSFGTGYETRMPSRGPSQIPGECTWYHSCIPMSKKDIREVQGFYVNAAKRARAAGFDIINIYGAEGVAITHQFLLPFYNKRTDEYGGSFENRARFYIETMEKVREAVGEDCAITTRFGIETLDDFGGISVEDEGVGFIELCDHLVDYWDLQVGGEAPPYNKWGVDAAASRFRAENWEKPWLDKVRAHTSKPIVGVGRLNNPDTMVEVIKSGQQDMIGAARASITDPFLPNKIEEGRLDDIRECIGCNICVSRFYLGAGIGCTQNATAGEEYRRGWHPEKFTKAKNADNDILIVGAGPAGMECARVLGKRGMRRIHLVDGEPELGGSMRWIAKLPALGEWARVVNYRQIQLDKLVNVEFIPNKRLDTQDVLEYGAEIVIIATGSHWATDGLSGTTHAPISGADAKLPHCLTPEQIMVDGKEPPGDRVLVYDCDGYFMGVSLAEKLVNEGRSVTYVTPFARAAMYTFYTEEGPDIYRNLMHLGVQIITGHKVTKVASGHIGGCVAMGTQISMENKFATGWDVDGIVLVTQRLSNDSLFRKLRDSSDSLQAEGINDLYRIGDCLAPRLIADCVFDGHRLAREIDSENPSLPLPYIREFRFLNTTDEDYERVLI